MIVALLFRKCFCLQKYTWQYSIYKRNRSTTSPFQFYCNDFNDWYYFLVVIITLRYIILNNICYNAILLLHMMQVNVLFNISACRRTMMTHDQNLTKMPTSSFCVFLCLVLHLITMWKLSGYLSWRNMRLKCQYYWLVARKVSGFLGLKWSFSDCLFSVAFCPPPVISGLLAFILRWEIIV